ncbi:hypothetical protein BOX15_Mlig029646g1 [Macrostomum lignano]|uniref:Uncharacterized protein n=1 Tax=Macrostomum lignano TaxID=282301 RepID=A0A267DYU6_9PLAT|nr:hypothetical protein BOX15_Mlig029646g1 [Macrostomum lignano]
MILKRKVIVRTLIGLAIVYWLHRKLNFESDAYYPDQKLGNFIHSRFPLPQAVLPSVKIVHFMNKNHLLFPEYRPYLASWRRVYPNYDFYFWTDADIDRLLASRYPMFKSFYDERLGHPLERSDFARVLVLHAFGGWYADLDAGSQLNAENLTKRHSLIVPLEPFIHAMVAFKRRRLVNNAIMYSIPGHPFWMFLACRIIDLVSELPQVPRNKAEAVETTGPLVMTLAMEQFAAANAATCGDLDKGLGGSYGCPYVPWPRRFLPLFDNTSNFVAGWARIMCYTVLYVPGIIDECQRMRAFDFVNVLPADAYTYHAFLHRTGAKGDQVNVSDWGLNIRFNPMNYLT